MQGYVNTTAGLRPLLLEGIEAVSYQQYSTANQQHGILSIRYIPNEGIGGGNVFVWVPFYTNQQFPIERFWDWVGEVSSGAVGKTLNSFYDNRPFVAIQTSSQSDNYNDSQAFVYKLADDATITDACNHVFEVDNGVNTYTNVVTNNATNVAPNIGDRIYVNTTQGYPGSSEGNTPSSTNPTLLDGTYSYLQGFPAYTDEKGGPPVNQTGIIYKVKTIGGFITEAELCPTDFTQLGGINDIDGFVFRITDALTFANAYNQDAGLCFALNTPSSIGGEWVPVKFGFLLSPNSAPQPDTEAGFPPPFVCNYASGTGGKAPQNAEVYMQDHTSLAYKKLQSGNTWNIKDISSPDPAATVSVGIDDLGANTSPFNDGIVIVVPPQSYYPPGTADYSFEIDWGSDFPDEKGNDLVCEYFKIAGGPSAFGQAPIQASVSSTNGTITQESSVCAGGAAA
jgi:hypothetical protein